MRGPLLLSLLVVGALRAQELPPSVERVLRGHGIAETDLSVLVQQVDAAQPLLSHLPDAPRNPASVMKLVTTFVALEELGPSYSWPTKVYFLGDYDGHTLQGDLALKGFGDPYLVSEEVWKMLGTLRRVGLADIQGDLVLDDTYFAPEEEDPGAFDNQPFRTYNVTPNALLMNFKAMRFDSFPAPDGRSVRIATDPVLQNLDVRNELALGAGPCRGYQVGISFSVPDVADAARVVLSGEFPRSCQHYAFTRSVLQHDTYDFGLVQALWSELGGQLRGRLRKAVIDEALEPALTWRSRPLGDVIRSINKNSNNVMTRQLLYTLGAEKLGPPGTREKGLQALRASLVARGANLGEFVMVNGAGLSREGRVSARLLARVLADAYRSAYAAEFISSLSLGGLDGTTRNRFGAGPETGQMHIKTGTLDDVSALAGYVRAGSGVTYIVVALLNSKDAHRGPGEELENALVRWVHALR